MCEKHSSLSASRFQQVESKLGVNGVVDSAWLPSKMFLSGGCLRSQADKFIMISCRVCLHLHTEKWPSHFARSPGLMWWKISLKSHQVCYITLFHQVLHKDQRFSSLTARLFGFRFVKQPTVFPFTTNVVNQPRHLLL